MNNTLSLGNLYAVWLVMLLAGCAGSIGSTPICEAGRVSMDGTCVSSAVADYAFCVRNRGRVEVSGERGQKFEAELKAAGHGASTTAELRNRLDAKYSTIASEGLERTVLDECAKLVAQSSASQPSSSTVSPAQPGLPSTPPGEQPRVTPTGTAPTPISTPVPATVSPNSPGAYGPGPKGAHDTPSSSSAQRTAGWITGGTGLALVAAGGVAHWTFSGNCYDNSCPASDKGTWTAAQVMYGVGAAALLGGTILVITGSNVETPVNQTSGSLRTRRNLLIAPSLDQRGLPHGAFVGVSGNL